MYEHHERPLKVAFITTLAPDRGNLAEYGGHLVRGLAASHEVQQIHVLANQVDNARAIEQLNDKIVVHRVWKINSTWSLLRLLWVVHKVHPDIVHINAGIRTWGASKLPCFVGAALCHLLHLVCPFTVVTLHTIGDTVRLDQMGTDIGFFTKLGIHFATHLYLAADLVTVTLASMQKTLQEKFAARNVVHVPHGTYGVRIHKPVQSEAQSAAQKNPRILAFGFWGAFKDGGMLVKAVQALRERGVTAELVLGGGPHPYFPNLYYDLVNKYRDHPYIHFTGYVPEEEIHTVFEQAAVVVLPYKTNAGASGVLNLCRSYGRPVIVSKEDGLVEQLRYEGGSGLVFSSEEGLIEALALLLKNPDLQQKMGEANLAVAKKMTIETQALKIVQFYRLIGRKRKKPLPMPKPASHIVE